MFLSVLRAIFSGYLFLGGGDDTADVIPAIIRNYWYMLLVWLLLVVLTYIMYSLAGRKTIRNSITEQKHPLTSFAVASYVVFIGLIIMGARGGWQLKPMTTADAIDYAPPRDLTLVLNSPFSIIATYYTPLLENVDSMPRQQYYSPIHTPPKGNFRRLNVVTIIMESMSKEYIGALNNHHRTYTPFLDSLISQSLVFDDAFSDGKKSVEGIPSVVASLPSWMNTAFITSPYSRVI